jgi:hypothetical protein
MGKSQVRSPSHSFSYSELREELLNAVSRDRKLIVFPKQIGYRAASVGCNLEIATKPAAITFPKHVEHIEGIVKVASRFNLHVQARSGGHSYGNYGKTFSGI